ncbi:MAG TPA: class I SAM-dependent methyltransferase [Terracidiphilus sp.]|nr:class I SAM-dependent methyltransferase [Terracidiphilus sp.]
MEDGGEAANRRAHWNNVYSRTAPTGVSWYRPHLETSLCLIESAADHDAAILDVGSGQSTLLDDLIHRGYHNVTACEISESAIQEAKSRLGENAALVQWQAGDILELALPQKYYDVWHDRALFHFLIKPADRQRYVSRMTAALKSAGHVIMATFGPEGPARCSGLEVCRYSAGLLAGTLGSHFRLAESLIEDYETPFGTTQQFLYCHFVAA